MASFRLLAAASLIAAPLFAGPLLAADPVPAAPRVEKRIVIVEEKAPGDAATATAPSSEVRRERRVVIGGPDGAQAMGEEHGCKDGQPPVEAQGTGEADGHRQVIRLRICGSGDKAAALDGVKRARARVAEDAQLSASVKQQVLQQLDAEIERLSKQG